MAENPEPLDTKYLLRLPTFSEFHTRQGKQVDSENKLEGKTGSPLSPEPAATSHEVLSRVYSQIINNLKEDLLNEISKQSPSFFEHTVVDLLKAMGYGDWSSESGSIVDKTCDEGIDGIIKENKLGFDAIYIQAKK